MPRNPQRRELPLKEAVQQIERLAPGNVLGVAADVRSSEHIQRWYRATIERFGSIDLLVTNSGGPPAGGFLSFDDAAWQNAFELLVLSAIRLVRTVLPSMEGRPGASILMITSSAIK